jgi:hypothetical protein
LGALLRIALTNNAVHIRRWNRDFRKQGLVGHRIVAVGVIRRDATFITEEEIHLGPFHPMLEPLSREQFINAPGGIAASQSNAKSIRLAMKRVLVIHKPFSCGYRQLFGSVKHKEIGRFFHGELEARSPTTSVSPATLPTRYE